MVNYMFVFATLLLLTVPTPRAGAGTEEAASLAAAAYDAKDWAKARILYEQLAGSQPANPRFWFRLGEAFRYLGQPGKARDSYASALKAGLPIALVGLPLASVEVVIGERDKAFSHLEQAVEGGFSDPNSLMTEEAFAPLRGDARFSAFIERAKRNRTPCSYGAENRQFDFWVGDWDVVATDGAFAQGTSHVVRELGECVIWENWTSIGTLGYAGKSYNVYNASLKRWEQFWVDNVGGMIHFYGRLEDDVMDFYTDEAALPNGGQSKRHLQFFNLGPDTVRQLSQQTNDGGKTWQVEYDFTYHRRKP